MRRTKFVEIVPPFEFDTLPVRETAKIILETWDGDFLFVAGQRGKLNLPGGGVDAGETAKEAALRELHEEAGINVDEISDLREAITVRGPITPANAPPQIAEWKVLLAKTSLRVAEISIPPDSEITGVAALCRNKCVKDPRVHRMAKMAMLFAPKDNRPPRGPSISRTPQSRHSRQLINA